MIRFFFFERPYDGKQQTKADKSKAKYKEKRSYFGEGKAARPSDRKCKT